MNETTFGYNAPGNLLSRTEFAETIQILKFELDLCKSRLDVLEHEKSEKEKSKKTKKVDKEPEEKSEVTEPKEEIIE